MTNSRSAALFLIFAASAGAASLRRTTAPKRVSTDVRDFVELSCNANMGPCSSFVQAFGTEENHAERVIIPCGQCYTMDLQAKSVRFAGGLDIQGKLVFPEGYKIGVVTPFVVVQGELQITAQSPINGRIQVYFFMTGDDTYQKFTPIGENANACYGETTCTIGKKAFVVAGGSVDMRGISDDTPTWTRLYDVVGNNTIVVDASVRDKWLPGAQILITSHTKSWDGHQVRKIKRVTSFSEPGYVQLQLDDNIVQPTTIKESSDFAVEVALLSRNIQFRGLRDSNPNHGGHFQVYHTPKVPQLIQGVDFLKFGQQGSLGYYPIHFHFCGDSPNSIVRKNTIRESFQRCVVIHGTNQVRIEDNIAYDTKGHCFVTEDGLEVDNEFIRNLGAQTGVPDEIIPDNGFNGEESDGEPATFWATNPTNKYVGNVAAGSIGSGFWYELHLRGDRAHLHSDLRPMWGKPGVFDNNVAHSNWGTTGAIRMYDPGFLPEEKAYFRNVTSYRNTVGIFIHKNLNIVVENGLFADNGIGMEVDRAEGIEVRSTSIIGESESYKALMARQDVDPVCYRRKVTGIDLHTWTILKGYGGTQFEDIEISGFSDTQCLHSRTINMDDHVSSSMRDFVQPVWLTIVTSQNIEQGQFEHFTGFKDMRMLDGIAKVNFCDLVPDDINTVYLTDTDGSLSPTLSSKTSTVMSIGPNIEKFVDASRCTIFEDRCFQYCEDTCFRSMRYEIEGRDTENFILEVCPTGNPNKCALFSDSRRVNNHPNAREEPRTFIAHVPVGQTYEGRFFTNTGELYKPSNLEIFYEKSDCPVEMGVFGIALDGFTNPPTNSPTQSPTAAPIVLTP